MSLTAALDASVLYPLPLRDTLLRVAQVGMYDPCWSERILDEAHEEIARLEPKMTNDPKDRHVLAAAAAGNADVLVTLNLRGLPTGDLRAALHRAGPPRPLPARPLRARPERNPHGALPASRSAHH